MACQPRHWLDSQSRASGSRVDGFAPRRHVQQEGEGGIVKSGGAVTQTMEGGEVPTNYLDTTSILERSGRHKAARECRIDPWIHMGVCACVVVQFPACTVIEMGGARSECRSSTGGVSLTPLSHLDTSPRSPCAPLCRSHGSLSWGRAASCWVVSGRVLVQMRWALRVALPILIWADATL